MQASSGWGFAVVMWSCGQKDTKTQGTTPIPKSDNCAESGDSHPHPHPPIPYDPHTSSFACIRGQQNIDLNEFRFRFSFPIAKLEQSANCDAQWSHFFLEHFLL